MQQHELPTISRFGNDLTFEPKTRNNGKQLARSKIDSNFKPLSSVCESFPSILICMQNSLFCLQNRIPSILIDLRAWVFSTIDRLGFAGYQTYTVRELNVFSERLFIQPMLWGNWLYRPWAGVPANRVCLAV